MNQARHGAILPCFSAHVLQHVLEGWLSPAFHSNDSFGFKHKPTTSISILCGVTVGCARQYVASSLLLAVHSLPFAHCSYSEQYRETVGSMVGPHRGDRGSHLKVLSSFLVPVHHGTGIWIPPCPPHPPRHCLLLSPAQEQRTVESRRDLRCPQRRGGEFPTSSSSQPSHHTLPAVLCPMASCISLAFIWQPLPPAPDSSHPKDLDPCWQAPLPGGVPCSLACLRSPGDRDYLQKGSKRGKLEACQLAPEDGEEEVGRTTDGTHRNAVQRSCMYNLETS